VIIFPRAKDLKGLQRVFAHYDYDEAKHALLEATNIFSWIAMETAEKLSHLYQTKVDKHMRKLIVSVCQKKRVVKDDEKKKR